MIDPWISSLKTEKIFEEDETLPEPVANVVMGESIPMVAIRQADHDYPCNCGVC